MVVIMQANQQEKEIDHFGIGLAVEDNQCEHCDAQIGEVACFVAINQRLARHHQRKTWILNAFDHFSRPTA